MRRSSSGLLGHSNGWWRSTAQRLLVERWSKARPDEAGRSRCCTQLLIDALKDKTNPLARLHALWTLAAMDHVDEGQLLDLAGDPHPACASTPCEWRPNVWSRMFHQSDCFRRRR